jgi:tripartite-type tricarboxylate transporter receptor subunit TctC
MRMKTLTLAAVVTMSSMVFSTSVAAQEFPAKPIKIISPYSAGSGPDVAARFLAERLSKIWGQQTVVEARPGANGFIALQAIKRSAADGHEIGLVGNAHMTINPALMKNTPYDVRADFAPVAMLYKTPFFIAVGAGSPFKNLADLIAFARANPGKLSYGSPYVGSPSHLGSAYLESLTETKMIHVPFKDTLQIFTSIAAGDVGWAFGTHGTMASLIQGGRLRLLAVGALRRLASHPDVPTVEEALGLKGFEVNAWVALVAPKRTPEAAIRKINADVNRLLEQIETRQQMSQLGFVGTPDTPEGFAQLIDRDTKKYGDLVRKSGITSD